MMYGQNYSCVSTYYQNTCIAIKNAGSVIEKPDCRQPIHIMAICIIWVTLRPSHRTNRFKIHKVIRELLKLRILACSPIIYHAGLKSSKKDYLMYRHPFQWTRKLLDQSVPDAEQSFHIRNRIKSFSHDIFSSQGILASKCSN
jgi:hypothetical protein